MQFKQIMVDYVAYELVLEASSFDVSGQFPVDNFPSLLDSWRESVSQHFPERVKKCLSHELVHCWCHSVAHMTLAEISVNLRK